MTNHTRKNFGTLQCGRGLAALAVVCFHANLTLGLPKYFGKEPAHIFSSGFSGIYYFFVLSGTVMLIAHWDQIGRSSRPVDFYFKRFKRIYLPLWAALIIITPALVTRVSLSDIFLAFSALPSANEKVLAVEWTLRHEILFYVIFGMLLWRPLMGGTILATWMAGSLLTAFFQISFPLSFVLSPLHLLFAAGMIGAIAINRGIGSPVIMLVVGANIFAFTWIAQAMDIDLSSVTWPALYGTGAALLVTGLARLETVRAVTIPRFLRALGDASYSIYLIHFPVVSASAKLAAFLIKSPAGQVLLSTIFFATVLMSVISGFFFHFLVERPALRLRIPIASTAIK